jgi:hypothetical protein
LLRALKTARRLLLPTLNVDLLRNLQGVAYLNAEVPEGAFRLAVTQQDPDGPQILRLLVDQRSLGGAHGMGPVLHSIQPNLFDPSM